MLMMIQGHTIFEMTVVGTVNVNVFPWYVWEFLRGLTAPLFLIVSGLVNVFANKRSSEGSLPKKTVIRRFRTAVMLLLLGYFLVFPADKVFHLAFIHSSVWVPFLQVNVLQLIGSSLLLLLAIFLLTRTDKALGITAFVIAIIITVLNPIVHQIKWFTFLPEYLAAYLSMEHGSIFTIFPFTGFLFYGVALGTILKKIPPEKRIFFLKKWGLILGFIFISVGIPINYYIHGLNLNFVDQLKANSGMMLIRTGCVFIAISLITMLYTVTTRLGKFYTLFGKRALFIYITHLIVLYGLPWFNSFGQVYHQKLPLYATIPIAFLIQIVSLGAAYYYEKSLKSYPGSKMFYRYAFSAIIIFLLFV